VTPADKFEALWTRYVEALEALDAAQARRGEGHGPRICRAARKRAEALHARLVREYDMGHLTAVPS